MLSNVYPSVKIHLIDTGLAIILIPARGSSG